LLIKDGFKSPKSSRNNWLLNFVIHFL
jgi:hypothetical protein